MKTFPRWLLILLLLTNALGAFFGGLSLMLDPTGAGLQMTTEVLKDAPFQDFFVPGLLLFLFIGVLPFVAALGLIFKDPWMPAPMLPFWRNRHWAWVLAFASGVGLIIWIVVQMLMIGYWGEIAFQPLYLGLGLMITLLALFPPVQQLYKKTPR